MKSLTDKVASALSQQMQRGELRPGDRLPPEAVLIQTLGVSRSVVREAMSRLQAAGLIETRHGVGSFVREAQSAEAARSVHIVGAESANARDAMAIVEFRIDLEGAAAALAATRRSAWHLTQIEQALGRFAAELGRSGGNVLDHDVAFHLLIARASGNRYFYDVLSQLGRAVSPRTRLGPSEIAELDDAGRLNTVLAEHRAVFQALVRQDADDARAAMRLHLSNSRERLRHAHASALSDAILAR